MLLLLGCLISVSYGAMLTSTNGRYCTDDSLSKSWYDAEIYCNDNFGGFSSFHSKEEFDEMEAFALSISSISWNGAYELEASNEIKFSDGSPYDYAVTISNQHLGNDEFGMIYNVEEGLTLGLNPNFATKFICNCVSDGVTLPPEEEELCPDDCDGISYDGCNRCMCRKNGKVTCTSRDCSPTMERTCLYTDIVRQACPEGCARYDLGGRQCLCRQSKGYMVCEPETALRWDIKPQCIETTEEMEADFNVNSSMNVFSFASQHWILSSCLAAVLLIAVAAFIYRSQLLPKKGEYQSLL